MSKFQVETFDVKKFDEILAKGLCSGVDREGQVCLNAAICAVLGFPHSDKDQEVVGLAPRRYSIAINDAPWSSPQARAVGLRDLGLAQLGSKGTVDDYEFANRLSEKTIRVLVPKLLRELFAANSEVIEVAYRCEKEGTRGAIRAAVRAMESGAAKRAAVAASRATGWVSGGVAVAPEAVAELVEAARAAQEAAHNTDNPDIYLILSANLALDTLRGLNSPGIALLNWKE